MNTSEQRNRCICFRVSSNRLDNIVCPYLMEMLVGVCAGFGGIYSFMNR